MRKFLPVIALALIVAAIFGTMYIAVEQAQRSEANNPQIQLAEDIAAGLDQKYQPELLVYGKVDMANSLAPFTIVYDKSGKVVTGSGYLDGKVPKAPVTVLGAAKGQDYNAVSWEPKPGIRIAAVTVAAKDYYVLSGRSLREAEKNIKHTMEYALMGAVASLILLSVIVMVAATAKPTEPTY